jgi:hypothetical protein
MKRSGLLESHKEEVVEGTLKNFRENNDHLQRSYWKNRAGFPLKYFLDQTV